MKIIGHRGAKGLAPENSIASIKRAINAKVDMIELDVRLHNGILVLSHEPTIRSQKYTSLEEALDTIGGKTPLNLEIKEERTIEHLPKALHGYRGHILFSSFEFSTLQAIKTLLPTSEIAVLEKWSGVRAVAEASLLGTKRVHINQQWLWSGFVRSMKHRGYSLYAYTVNNRDRAEELHNWGVDGIFTDYPSLFKEESSIRD